MKPTWKKAKFFKNVDESQENLEKHGKFKAHDKIMKTSNRRLTFLIFYDKHPAGPVSTHLFNTRHYVWCQNIICQHVSQRSCSAHPWRRSRLGWMGPGQLSWWVAARPCKRSNRLTTTTPAASASPAPYGPPSSPILPTAPAPARPRPAPRTRRRLSLPAGPVGGAARSLAAPFGPSRPPYSRVFGPAAAPRGLPGLRGFR